MNVLSELEMRARELGVEPPGLLVDMRYVYQTKGDDDSTQAERSVRELLRRNPREFFGQMASMEKVYAGLVAEVTAVKVESVKEVVKGSVKKEEPVVVDKGYERITDLLDQFLEEFGYKDGNDK